MTDGARHSTTNIGRAIAPGSPIVGGGWSSPISLPSINAANARCAASGMDVSISARNIAVSRTDVAVGTIQRNPWVRNQICPMISSSRSFWR